MPVRYVSSRPTRLLQAGLQATRPRLFHISSSFRDDVDSRNHYEILNVHPDASPAEIKRSFYKLSKTHHPDHNRHDPHAPRRFMRISEAYSVLAHTEKRAVYDRDVMRRHPHHGHGHAPHGRARGSYHSTGPAGGRPASGLSRRRGTFQGPPPSFFRSGGWGAHGAKRKAAHDDSTGGASPGMDGKNRMGGMGPGQDPYGHRDDVPHFDRESHEKTHRRGDERRATRVGREGMPGDPDGGVATGFLLVTGILATSILFPILVMGGGR